MNNRLVLNLLTVWDLVRAFFGMLIIGPWEVIRMVWRYYPMALILSLAFILRLPQLTSPMWYDEQFSLIAARLPLYRTILASAGDVHPPLSYIIMAPWSLGPNWFIRIPSLLLSLGSILLFWIAMNGLSIPRRPALFAALFMAVSPFQLYYANEARMYALLQFCILLALVAGMQRKWWVMALAGIAAVYTQNWGVIFLVTVAIVLITRNPHEWWKVAIVGAIVFVAWLPWVPVIRAQTLNLITLSYWIPPATLGRVVQTFYSLITGPGTVVKFAGAGIFAMCMWILSALVWMLAKRPVSWVPVLVLAFMPALIGVIVSNVGNMSILIPRPLIASTPWLFLMLVYPIDDLMQSPRRVQLVAALFIVPLMIIGTLGYLLRGSDLRSDKGSEAAMAVIRSNWKPGDVIYHEQDGSAIYFRAFAPGVPQYLYPPCQKIGSYVSEMTHQAMGIRTAPLDSVPGHRVWLIKFHFSLTPQCEIDDWAGITAKAVKIMSLPQPTEQSNFYDGEIYLLER